MHMPLDPKVMVHRQVLEGVFQSIRDHHENESLEASQEEKWSQNESTIPNRIRGFEQGLPKAYLERPITSPALAIHRGTWRWVFAHLYVASAMLKGFDSLAQSC